MRYLRELDEDAHELEPEEVVAIVAATILLIGLVVVLAVIGWHLGGVR